MATLHAVCTNTSWTDMQSISPSQRIKCPETHVLTEQLGLVAFDPAVPAELLVAIPDVLHDDDAQLVAVVGELGLLSPVGAPVIVVGLAGAGADPSGGEIAVLTFD